MSQETLLNIFMGNVLVLWIFLTAVSLLLFRRERLHRVGHSPAYTEFLRRDNLRRCLGIGIAIPLIELLAAGIVFLWFGEISTYEHFIYICLVTLVLIIPFPVLDSIATQKKQKALAMETNTPIVIDLKHQVWHLVFKPAWEFVAAILTIGFLAWTGQYFSLAELHIIILWLLYLAAQKSKFLTGPSLSDLYLYNLLFMMINHLLIIFHLIRIVLLCCPVPGRADHVAGIVLIAIWSIKLLIYVVHFPRFRRELSCLTENNTVA